MTPLTAFISAVGAVLVAWGGAWISGGQSAQKELGRMDTKIEVVKTTEELHYKELVKVLERIETKMDKIAPPTVPKTQTLTPSERAAINAPLIQGIRADGAHLNENEKTE